MKLLCKIGIHEWRVKDWEDGTLRAGIIPYKCILCGKEKWYVDSFDRTRLGWEAAKEVERRVNDLFNLLKTRNEERKAKN